MDEPTTITSTNKPAKVCFRECFLPSLSQPISLVYYSASEVFNSAEFSGFTLSGVANFDYAGVAIFCKVNFSGVANFFHAIFSEAGFRAAEKQSSGQLSSLEKQIFERLNSIEALPSDRYHSANLRNCLVCCIQFRVEGRRVRRHCRTVETTCITGTRTRSRGG